MLSLARLECLECNRQFYGTLPTGFGRWYPVLFNPRSGNIVNDDSIPEGSEWYASIFNNRRKDSQDVEITEEGRAVESHPILINCIDRAYGHVILKLLNIQHYLDNESEYDLIILVPEYLKWLVPDEVSAIWSVDISLSEGDQWSDSLARAIHHRLSDYNEAYIGLVNMQPYPGEFDIQRFSGVEPLSLNDWDTRPNIPKVTFIWREDTERLWCPRVSEQSHQVRGYLDRIIEHFSESIPHMNLLPNLRRRKQRLRVLRLGNLLGQKFDNLDFAVAGAAKNGGLPDWITDLRFHNPSTEEERVLCERYAKSHVVVGVHGSHMLLPYAHAGSVIQILPQDRMTAVPSNIITPRKEVGDREMLFRYHWFPTSVSANEVAELINTILTERHRKKIKFGDQWSKHLPSKDIKL